LAFDELFFVQLLHRRANTLARAPRAGIVFQPRRTLTTALKDGLPFALTAAQVRAVREIVADMGSPRRMHRLLQGDVGSGKTVVALFAALLALENGYQAAFMAPTELLAEQHDRSIGTLLEPLGIEPVLLIGSLGTRERRAAEARLASDDPLIAIGTNALVQEATTFGRLGLAIVDEQHRFGVEHRAALGAKGDRPDMLIMSATPIPRSLALTLYGDLDVTALRERPPGRGDVTTALRGEASRARIYAFLQRECAAGRQAYVIYPVIEESEKADLRAATTMSEALTREFPDLAVGLVHGRLPSDGKDAVMRAFRDGAVHILVATTVIEVGIDVPNASVMLIEHAERFGLAQLHQLRGRVGRGAAASHCILLSDAPEAVERLGAFAATSDGFAIAELDLQTRGMGELTGARQSGAPRLRFANFATDLPLLERARQAAGALIAADPALERPAHAAYRTRILERYERGFELFRVG
jgi:ATP-dependent DNA helicase RecG